MNIKKNLINKVLVIAIPTYAIAIYTEAMVYTVPMLAITTLIATSIFEDTKNLESRVDEDGDIDDGDSETDSYIELGE
jgi:hypothetical protein